MARTKFFLGLLTVVAIGMIIGSLFLQLAYILKLEELSGIFDLKSDNEAVLLRLGFVKPEILSWSPRITLFHNFLSSEECDYLIEIARPRLEVSTVGKGVKSKVRTSFGMFLTTEERELPIVQAIEKRISVFSQIPVPNGEDIQVLRYGMNQYYMPHPDYFDDPVNLKRGGQRIATMLMYLSGDVEGGETFFPWGLNGTEDSKSIHGGCAVLKGEKWSATKWMRQRTFI